MCLDLDPCKVWNASFVCARKPHQCSECNRTIETGERYERIVWCDGETWGTLKICAICQVFHEIVADVCGESQKATDGSLGESLNEHEDYWREAAGKAWGVPYDDWGMSDEDAERLLGPGLLDLWQTMTGQVRNG